MLSVSEGRQINTTKHFGGGVNVSAGATLLNKGWCSLSLSLSPKHTHSQRFIHVTCHSITHLDSHPAARKYT